MNRAFPIVCSLTFGLLSSVAVAAPTVVAHLTSIPSQPFALRDPASGRIDVAYTSFNWINSQSIRRLWSTRSLDGGISWATPSALAPVEPGAIYVQLMSPNLVPMNDKVVLIYQWSTTHGIGLWRAVSADGHSFTTAAPIDLGWLHSAEQLARVVPTTAAGLAMLYQRRESEGDRPAGLYFAHSSDGGVTWDKVRTNVTTDVRTGDKPGFAFRPTDGLHVATYSTGSEADTRAILVRATHDPSDWNSTPITTAFTGTHLDPSLAVMADGTFLLTWAKAVGQGYDLVGRRSSDGVEWDEESTLVEGNGASIHSPFALPTASPAVAELYWARTTNTTPIFSAGVIEYDRVVVIDVIFADGFGGN